MWSMAYPSPGQLTTASTCHGETVLARGSLLRRNRHLAFVSVTPTCAGRLVAFASVTKSLIETAPADAAHSNR